jgi:uncharacterized cofD-like protein
MLVGFAIALLLQDVNRYGGPGHWLDRLTLGFLPSWLRLLIFLVVGLVAMGLALRKLAWREPLSQPRMEPLHSVDTPINHPQPTLTSAPAMPAVHSEGSQETPAQDGQPNGIKIVAIGGGTGMPQLLRGLQHYTNNITAIVTVADDGGSSGRLRHQMGTLPPGDFRNNIAALSQSEDLMTRLLQYRFADQQGIYGENAVSSELAGHSFGNLFISTMAAVTGSFDSGLAESSRVLNVRGQILPSTLENITLCAEISRTNEAGEEIWSMVEGESNIPEAGGRIQRVFLKPDTVHGYPMVTRAILQADLIVAAPGSFFTSVMPNLLVPSVRDAICASPALRIYVCNVATQPGETDGFDVCDHMRQLRLHAGDAFTMVLANDNYDLNRQLSAMSHWVPLPDSDRPLDYTLFTGDVIDDERPWRHDADKLATRLMEVFSEHAETLC